MWCCMLAFCGFTLLHLCLVILNVYDEEELLENGLHKPTRQSYKEMSKIANLPVTTVIVGHEHDDHWLGNSFYKEKFNATLIGIK